MKKTVSLWKGDAAVGLGLAALGSTIVWLSRSVPFGSPAQPGPGLMPTALGLALSVVGVLCAVRAFRARRADDQIGFGETRAVLMALILGVAVATFEPLGFLLTAIVFLALLFKVLGAGGWGACALLALAVGGGAWAVFAKVLSVQLPLGVLPI